MRFLISWIVVGAALAAVPAAAAPTQCRENPQNMKMKAEECQVPEAEESQACYARWDPNYDQNFRSLGPDDMPEFSEELAQSCLFETIIHRRYLCRREYKARAYCDLLATFSNILAFDVVSRDGFLRCIERLIEDRFAGRIVRADVHDLWVARTPM